jgi:BlaI family transcriptional regulator, penicillinase repressor
MLNGLAGLRCLHCLVGDPDAVHHEPNRRSIHERASTLVKIRLTSLLLSRYLYGQLLRVMTKRAVELTKSEWTIIKAVWDLEPCAAPDVQEALQKKTKWTYSTVRTLMDRMVAKGLLTGEKIRHMTLYRSAVTREQAQRSELLQTLKHAFDGALTPLFQCLLKSEKMSEEELAELEALVRAQRKAGPH